jgi:hypothetical protein
MARGFSKAVSSQQKQTDSLTEMNILNTSFFEHFANLEDPRIERSKEHLLKDIIAIAILAIISGADGWVAIEAYGNAIDGKTMKQSYERNDPQKALDIVTAWSSSHQLVLGQKKVHKNLMN